MALPYLLAAAGGALIGWLVSEISNSDKVQKAEEAKKKQKKSEEDAEKERKKNEQMKSDLQKMKSELQEMERMKSELQEMKQKQSQLSELGSLLRSLQQQYDGINEDINGINKDVDVLQDLLKHPDKYYYYEELIEKYEELIEEYDLKGFSKDYYNLLLSMKYGISAVACLGLHGGGKTAILKALTGLYDSARLVEGRGGTQTIQKYDVENFCYVDTPGLGVGNFNYDAALQVVKQSTFNLFVHDITIGEFTQTEVDYLRHISQNWEEAHSFLERTIFILSHKDKLNEAGIEQMQNAICDQIKDIFHAQDSHISVVVVSAMPYNQAKMNNEMNNKEELIQSSNIPALQEMIDRKQEQAQQLWQKQLWHQQSCQEVTSIQIGLKKLIESLKGKPEQLAQEMNRISQEIYAKEQEIVRLSTR